eukprot:703652-Amphidinium_carterae.1
MFGRHVIATWSVLQQVVATSSGEAEFYSMALAAAHGLESQSFLVEAGWQQWAGSGRPRIQLRSDSTAGIGMASRLGLGRMKHVQIRFLWLQSYTRDKTIEIEKESTERNLADLGTKPLDSGRFYKLLGLLPLRHRRQMSEQRSEEWMVGASLLDEVVAVPVVQPK